jgi:hypothetical protein
MEAALLINAWVDEEERIDGENEEATGEKSGQSQNQEVVKKDGEEAGKKTDRSQVEQVESGSEEKLGRRAGSVKTPGGEEGRTG